MAAVQSNAAHPQRIPLVVLYAETRGFTRTSEILDPSAVRARVTEFFAVVRAAVEGHGGVVRNVLNDTLAASFEGDGSAGRAVEAAQEIQGEFIAIEEAWERDYGIRAAVALGLHAGETVVGPAGEGMPGQLLIVGDSLSIAERLLHRARAGEYLMSKAVVDMLAASGFELATEVLPPLEIPRRDPIRIYGVVRDARLDFT
jgi:adenylate cyclase